VSQHTSSTQNPEAHTDGVVHAAPFGFGVLVGVPLAVAVDVCVAVGVRVTVAVRVAVAVQLGCDTPPQVLHLLKSHSAGGLHWFPGQQDWPASPHGTQMLLVGEHTLLGRHGKPGKPIQQGCPVAPQSLHVPIRHVRPRPHSGSSRQQGWLEPPQATHVPPTHSAFGAQLSGGAVLQHGWAIWPQGVQKPAWHTDVSPQNPPMQHG